MIRTFLLVDLEFEMAVVFTPERVYGLAAHQGIEELGLGFGLRLRLGFGLRLGLGLEVRVYSFF